MVSGSPIDVKYIFPEAIANFTLRNNVEQRNFNKFCISIYVRSLRLKDMFVSLSLSLSLSQPMNKPLRVTPISVS